MTVTRDVDWRSDSRRSRWIGYAEADFDADFSYIINLKKSIYDGSVIPDYDTIMVDNSGNSYAVILQSQSMDFVIPPYSRQSFNIFVNVERITLFASGGACKIFVADYELAHDFVRNVSDLTLVSGTVGGLIPLIAGKATDAVAAANATVDFTTISTLSGDLSMLFWESNVSVLGAVPAGYTVITEINTITTYLGLAFKILTGAEPAQTFVAGAWSHLIASGVVFRNVDVGSGTWATIKEASAQNAVSSGSIAVDPIETLGPNRIVVSAIGKDTNANFTDAYIKDNEINTLVNRLSGLGDTGGLRINSRQAQSRNNFSSGCASGSTAHAEYTFVLKGFG